MSAPQGKREAEAKSFFQASSTRARRMLTDGNGN